MKYFSEETRRKMSESAKRRCERPEWKATQHARATKLPVDTVKKLYENGHTQQEIADMLGVSQKVICRCMRNNGLKTRKRIKRDQRGERNSYWHGGRIIDDYGYVHVKKDGHPRAKSAGGYVREHILVAEAEIGRPLGKDEVVHHINGDKTDNRPCNLAVMKKGDHTRYHSDLRWGKHPATPEAVTKKHFPEEEEGD